jgi:hypothetical protein
LTKAVLINAVLGKAVLAKAVLGKAGDSVLVVTLDLRC